MQLEASRNQGTHQVAIDKMQQPAENLTLQDERPRPERRKKSYRISAVAIFLLAAVFICSLVAAGAIGYSIASMNSQEELCARLNESGIHATNSDSQWDITDAQPKKPRRIHNLRLPRAIEPISYNITLVPFLMEGNYTFHGEVKIIIRTIEPTRNITLHAASLHIHTGNVYVRYVDDAWGLESLPSKIMKISRQYADNEKQFYVIKLKDMLMNNTRYEIGIKFTGELNDYMQGFYRSSYMLGNKTRWVAATQFQPTDARRAFPCFDEPALKAKFRLNLARPANMSTLFNMPILRSVPFEGLDNYVWDIYAESKPMSSYLVAFAVTDFSHLKKDKSAVWARADAIKSAEYALKIGPQLLKFYEKFFDIEFPLPKIDMLALPDFTAGAMENWGLITFRESAMLFEEGNTPQVNKQRIATVMAHEMAHQWFGNLVTPDWWSELWLNEGFATYLEYVGTDSIEPAWKSMDMFVIHEVQGVFQLDALKTSHQISVQVQNPEEINDIFDRISYGKGATVIRMMRHFLTPHVFKVGLANYLREKSYEATDQETLWKYLTAEAQRVKLFDNETSVKTIMDTWTLQTGFPIVWVSREYTTTMVTFNQSRFVLNYTTYEALNKEENFLWWIPLSFTTTSRLNFEDTRPVHWIRGTRELRVDEPSISHEDWFLVNIQQTGFYRVNYDNTNWGLLSKYLRNSDKFMKIAPANRAQLIDDSLNLARSGYLSYTVALDMTLYLKHETEYIPWRAAISCLNFIDSMLLRKGDYHLFQKYFIHLIEKIYHEFGFVETAAEASDMIKGIMRTELLSTACHLGYTNCTVNSFLMFHKWMNEPSPDSINPISPNLRSIVYCTAIKNGNQEIWDFAWERYVNAIVSSEKEMLLSALGCTKEIWLLERLLQMSLDESSHIRKHDIIRVFGAVSNNVIGQPIAFQFLRDNFDKIKYIMGNSMGNVFGLVKYASRRINKKFELHEFKQFIHEKIKEPSRPVLQAIEQAETNYAWTQKSYDTVVEWLKNFNESLL